MGSVSSKQKLGIGSKLLSAVLSQSARRGFNRAFLGATPAGYKLYENLGFKTVFSANVWAMGETHQS